MSDNFEPEIVALYCRRALAAGERLPEGTVRGEGFSARFVMLPCSSKVEVNQVVALLEAGADGVQVIGCPPGGCRFLTGSTKADKKIQYVQRMLSELEAGYDRVGMIRAVGLSVKEIMDAAHKRAQAVKELGPNPMKQEPPKARFA